MRKAGLDGGRAAAAQLGIAVAYKPPTSSTAELEFGGYGSDKSPEGWETYRLKSGKRQWRDSHGKTYKTKKKAIEARAAELAKKKKNGKTASPTAISSFFTPMTTGS